VIAAKSVMHRQLQPVLISEGADGGQVSRPHGPRGQVQWTGPDLGPGKTVCRRKADGRQGIAAE
jgi:hypothetical protein